MTPTQRKLLARVERRVRDGGIAPTRAELAAVCAMVREFDAELTQADRETRYSGSTVRFIDVLLERVSAGDSPRDVCAECGFEWNRRPDLGVLVRLVALRESVRVWKAAREESENEEARAANAMVRALKRAGGGRAK